MNDYDDLLQDLDDWGMVQPRAAKAIRKLLARVAELEASAQEPVAWISDSPTKGNGRMLHWTKAEAWRWSSNITPLYTAPTASAQTLTDEQLDNAIRNFSDELLDYICENGTMCEGITARLRAVARAAIEAANTGRDD